LTPANLSHQCSSERHSPLHRKHANLRTSLSSANPRGKAPTFANRPLRTPCHSERHCRNIRVQRFHSPRFSTIQREPLHCVYASEARFWFSSLHSWFGLRTWERAQIDHSARAHARGRFTHRAFSNARFPGCLRSIKLPEVCAVGDPHANADLLPAKLSMGITRLLVRMTAHMFTHRPTHGVLLQQGFPALDRQDHRGKTRWWYVNENPHRIFIG
jgi:hypothetical protein